jgi:hypothetical protein
MYTVSITACGSGSGRHLMIGINHVRAIDRLVFPKQKTKEI